MELLESALRLSTPLVFAALGGVLSERVGVVNIALDAMLLSGAFAAMAAADRTGPPWLGVAAAGGAGLQLRAVGEAPEAARAAGVAVDRVRVLWLAAGGALAGMGGAYLSLVAAGRFTENCSSGKGYLALASVIFGRWHPLGVAGAVL